MVVTIDPKAGFCWGVVRTVDIAETTLTENTDKKVYILGEIIHNPKETGRLEEKGLVTISHDELERIGSQEPDAKVIIRAHGEPPKTYERAEQLGINLIDATCPLVTNLQNRVRKYYDQGFQIIIFGKREHAEVIGLRGVCNDNCIIIKSMEEAEQIVDFNRKTVLISQTTMDKPTFYRIKEMLESKIKDFHDLGDINENFIARDTTCRAVSHREEPLLEFASQNDVLIFVSGRKSSNGKGLYNACKAQKERTYFVEDISDIDWSWFDGAERVGISGATSTPQWFMQKVKQTIENQFNTEPVLN